MNRRLFQFMHLALLAVLVCSDISRGEEPRETDKNFDNYKLFAAQIAKADKVDLYEGLPHQRFEKKLLDEQVRTKKIVRHHSFLFYAEPLPVKEEDANKLTRLFTDTKSFKPFREKKCEFHPDYCIEWHVGKEAYQCLVCFGCHEVKVFGPKAELYCDIGKEAYDKFKKVLQPYRKHRPKSKE